MTSPIPENRVGVSSVSNVTGAEYQNSQLIASLVRQAFLNAGLGQQDPNCPLLDIIEPGSSVLLKPNWVLHYNQSGQTMDCMVTHPEFILAAVKEVAATGAGRIFVADAPIQSTDLDKLTPEIFRGALRNAAGKSALDIIDFRRTIIKNSDLVSGVATNLRSEDRRVRFDLGESSLLEPISQPEGCFRNTSYSPEWLAKAHCSGRHEYVLSKEVFEVDVIINLPKLKAHRKAGVTAALKNLVGMNGDKDNLPHHRVGGTFWGGDCYNGFAPLKRLAETLLDKANHRIGTAEYINWVKWVNRFLGWHVKLRGDGNIEGAWFKNDTVWRMVLDLNRILLYGRINGTMAEVQQRRIYSLTDAIVAGEGDGPLSPTPVNLGVVTFSSSSAFADLVHTTLMGFDWRKIPLVREAFGGFEYPLTSNGPESCNIVCNGEWLSLDDLAAGYSKRFRPPSGWAEHIELTREA